MQTLLETIYTCLTNRKIESVRPKNDEDLIPPFARSTAVQVLHDFTLYRARFLLRLLIALLQVLREQLKDSELKSIFTDTVQVLF